MANLDIDLLDPATFSAGPPHEIFDALRIQCPVYGQPHPSGKGTVWSVMRYDDVREVSRKYPIFSSRPYITFTLNQDQAEQTSGSLIYEDPPEHTRLRAFAAKAFSPRVVSQFEGWVRELCVAIADRVSASDGEFDACTEIALSLPTQVICSILGIPQEDRDWMVKTVQCIFGEFDPKIGAAGQYKALDDLSKYALRLRELKLREPGLDMATELANAEGNGRPLDDIEYSRMFYTLAGAGIETTNTLIAQSLVLQSNDLEIRHALNTTDRKQLSAVVDELLRLISPGMYFGRTATQDTILRDAKIAKGDFVMMWYTAANRDPEVFEEPHKFNAQRSRRNHVAFGAGSPHTCLGNYLAKLEIELLYQEFAKRELRLDLAGEPVRLPSIFVNGLRHAPMIVRR